MTELGKAPQGISEQSRRDEQRSGEESNTHGLQSTKDLPIKDIERQALHKRKEKYGTHHVKEHEAGEIVGQDLVEKALHEKEEKDRSRGLEELAA